MANSARHSLWSDCSVPRLLIIWAIVLLGPRIGWSQEKAATAAAVPDAQNQTQDQRQNQATTIVFVGDSLTAGYGVKKEEAFPALVEKKLKAKGRALRVINGGISGSLSSGADGRVRWYAKMKPRPDLLVLALGANDGLQGTPPAVIKKNLAAAIDEARASGMKVLLVGIKVFPNFGPRYTREFDNLYVELAKEKKVPLVPFLLEGVGGHKELNLADGKHPNPKGHEVVAEHIVKAVEPIL